MGDRGQYRFVPSDTEFLMEGASALRRKHSSDRRRRTGAQGDTLIGLRRMNAKRRVILGYSAVLWFLFAGVVVGVLFLSVHMAKCSGEDAHSGFFPEPFRVPVVIETVAAQTFSKFIAALEAGFVLSGASIEPGAPSVARYAAVVLEHLAKSAGVYTTATIDSTVYVTESCHVTLSVANCSALNATDAAWFRPVKSTCKNVTSSAPLKVQLVPEKGAALSAYSGADVVLLFHDMPFAPLVGDAHVPRDGQALFVQVDRALWDTLQSVVVTVTATAHVSQRTVKTYVVSPIAGAGGTLLYVAANLDGAYTSSDNWGSLALLMQLVTALQFKPTERARTAFVLSNADSVVHLASLGLLPRILDIVVLSHCGLINGRDALYSTKSALGPAPLLRVINTRLVLGQPAYLSGRALVSDSVPAWDVTSYSSLPKTIQEATVAGGTAGVAVSPRSPPATVAHTSVSVLALMAQLQTLLWMLEAGAISGSDISALFV
jgi:hypothetical protein